MTRLELATSSLARRCSTTELHPHFEEKNNVERGTRCNLLVIAYGARVREELRRVSLAKKCDATLVGQSRREVATPFWRDVIGCLKAREDTN